MYSKSSNRQVIKTRIRRRP